MIVLFALASVVVLCFAFVLVFGAPYLPTLKPQVHEALRLIDLKPGQRLLELGSGDGRVLIAAAKQGIHATGYELNPILVLTSRWLTRHHRSHVRVVWGNFWRHKLPPTDGIFVFLLNPYMSRLDKKITQDLDAGVKLVSFAFEIPGRRPSRRSKGLYLYKY